MRADETIWSLWIKLHPGSDMETAWLSGIGSVVLEQGISSVIQPGSEQKQICHLPLSVLTQPPANIWHITQVPQKSGIAFICEYERERLVVSAVPSVHDVSSADATSRPKAPAVPKESGTSGTVGNINCENIHEAKMLPTRRECWRWRPGDHEAA